MEAQFLGANLRLARSFNGLTLEELADQVGKSKQFIHRLETNLDQPSELLAIQLAKSLSVSRDFFTDNSQIAIAEDQFHFRKLLTTKLATKQKALAKAEIFKRLIEFCDSKLELPKYSILEYPVDGLEDIERAAEKLRNHLGLGLGPIQNLAHVAENAGIFITTFKDVSYEVDALSVVANRPFIVRNEVDRYACRLRFDIAHELGHLVMHVGMMTGDRSTESEANRFGGAFLMPRSSFAKEFPVSSNGRIGWKSLPELKFRWKASKAAMLMRARQLGLIDDRQLRGSFIYLKNNSEAKFEHEDNLIEIEKPVLLDKSIKTIVQHYGLSIEAIAKAMNIQPGLLNDFLSEELVDELTFPSNVVRLPRQRQS